MLQLRPFNICRHAGRAAHLPLTLPASLAFTAHRRTLLTIAIETSCDDTSVALLEKHDATTTTSSSGPIATSSGSAASTSTGPTATSSSGSAASTSPGPSATLHFHEKVTADNSAHTGIHPLVALESHQASLALLVQKALRHLRSLSTTRKPDFVTVTRGPGMRTNLMVGLDTAKGLATAWDVPLLGVHHMQAHALTPRLMSALEPNLSHNPTPAFPFLSLLVSGGHTMLINSISLNHHHILAKTSDIAIGDCLDKAARAIVPPADLHPPYGRALEHFAFPRADADYNYVAPRNRRAELGSKKSEYGWTLNPPLVKDSRSMQYSYSGLLTKVERLVKWQIDCETGALIETPRPIGEPAIDERRAMAREVMRVAFEHLASRLGLYLASLPAEQSAQINTVVISGGVAANAYLRHVMRSFLDVRGFAHIQICCPPIELCTDNAAMIAWAGMEMWEAGWTSELSITPIRSWSMDRASSDGGILGATGWTKRILPPNSLQ